MTVSLKPLLDLQQVDLTRDRLVERKEHLPERGELTELEGRMKEVEAVIDRVGEEQERVVREIDRLEQEAGIIASKIEREESRMYSGEVVNPKELSAIQDEVAMFRRQKAPLEEEALDLMMRRDELQEERERLRREVADLEREAEGVRERIEKAVAEIDRELEAEDAKRSSLVEPIPSDVLEIYEDLRGQKRGIGVGALEQGICSACREQLSAMEIDRVRRQSREGEHLFRCEHCRRLLVVE